MGIDRLFSRTVCINLDRRPDRWRRMERRFFESGLGAIERFRAVDGADIEPTAAWAGQAGAFACLKSHLAVLASMKARGDESVLILEDDVEFADDLTPRFRQAFAQAPADWAVLYLGGLHNQPPIPVSGAVSRVTDTLSSFAYAVRREAVEALLSVDPSSGLAIDELLVNLQGRLGCYCVMPHVCWVDSDHSDVVGNEQDHWYLRESITVGSNCLDDLAGSICLVAPSSAPGWRHASPAVRTFVVDHFRRVVPGLVVVDDDQPVHCPFDPVEYSRRADDFLGPNVSYVVVAGSQK